MRPTLVLAALTATAALWLSPQLAGAQQSPFSPQVMVNNSAITGFELTQRELLLEVLNSPGDLADEARKRLIEDRLRVQTAQAQGIKVTPEQVTEGMTEFAARGQLSLDDFVAAIGERGVAQETFRDFVAAGVAWREVVRARYAGQINITDAEIDRALALSAQRGALRVLLSELILPAPPEQAAQSRALARELSQTIRSEADFAAAAAEYSIAASGAQGGRIDWIPLANLPPQIGALIGSLRPGQVTPPVPVPGAIALFLLRGVQETGAPGPSAITVEYAQLRIAGGRTPEALAEAARVRDRVDTCDDLYTVARDLPPANLTRDRLPLAQVPQDIALELAKLDETEVSTSLVRGNALILLMLCERTPLNETPPSRDDLRNQLTNQRVARLADIYLAELLANADIRTP